MVLSTMPSSARARTCHTDSCWVSLNDRAWRRMRAASVGVTSARGEAADQQGFTGDVEATQVLSQCGRVLPQSDCLGPTISQRGMGAENRNVGVRGLTTFLEPPQQLRRFYLQACAVSGPSCCDQQWVGVRPARLCRASIPLW